MVKCRSKKRPICSNRSALDTLGLTRFDLAADAPRVMDALCDEVRAANESAALIKPVRIERRSPDVIGRAGRSQHGLC
jgi:hypothetical protein